MCIIERNDRIYNIMNESMFFKLLNSDSDKLSNEQMEDEFGADHLPIWNTPYPKFNVKGGAFMVTKHNSFNNNLWIDDTQLFRDKHASMNNDVFEKNKNVIIKGLKSKSNWNGLKGQIIDDYDFKKERWPIHIASINKSALIKTINISSI